MYTFVIEIWQKNTDILLTFYYFLSFFVIGICDAPRPLGCFQVLPSGSGDYWVDNQAISEGPGRPSGPVPIFEFAFFENFHWNLYENEKFRDQKFSKFFDLKFFIFFIENCMKMEIFEIENFRKFSISIFFDLKNFRGPTLSYHNFFWNQPNFSIFFIDHSKIVWKDRKSIRELISMRLERGRGLGVPQTPMTKNDKK